MSFITLQRYILISYYQIKKRHLAAVFALFNDIIISYYIRKSYICIHYYNILNYGFESKRSY